MRKMPTAVLLYFALGSGIGLCIVIKTLRRALADSERCLTILGVGTVALALWVAASYAVGFMTFVTGFGVAHLRPQPTGPFPEGWEIYRILGVYAVLGTALIMTVGRVPPERAAA